MPDALVVSNVAAGIVVGKFGTASVTGTELKEALKEKDIQTPSWRHRDNILTPEPRRSWRNVSAVRRRWLDLQTVVLICSTWGICIPL